MVTVRESKYHFGQKPPLFNVKNGPVKSDIFDENAYLILIEKCKSAIFDVFDENHHFLHISGHHWFSTVFHCFLSVRFSLGLLGK